MSLLAHITVFELVFVASVYGIGVATGIVVAWGWRVASNPSRREKKP